jgi:hypothetical protein
MGIRYLDEEIKSKGSIKYLDEISESKIEKEKISIPFLPKKEKVEQQISERPEAWDILMQEYRTPYAFKEHPIKSTLKPAVTMLKTLAVPYQRGEAALASAGLEAQARKPLTQIAKGFWKGISGQKPTEFGDIIRTTGFGGKFNEALATMGGLGITIGATNIISKGKIIKGINKGAQFFKSKLPQIMNKDYALNRAKLASEGLDDLYKGLSKEYDKIYNEIGAIQITGENFNRFQEIIDDLPQNIINKIKKNKLIGKTTIGEIIPDVENLKIIKGIIRKFVPEKVWNGKVIGDINTANLEQIYGNINDLIANSIENGNELLALNQRYKNFMKMRKTLGHVLYDQEGNIKGEGLQRLFSPKGARHVQQYFEKFANMHPEATQIMTDMIKWNKRQGLKRIIKKGIGLGLTGGGLYTIGKTIRR